jgi:hypothetical protein
MPALGPATAGRNAGGRGGWGLWAAACCAHEESAPSEHKTRETSERRRFDETMEDLEQEGGAD